MSAPFHSHLCVRKATEWLICMKQWICLCCAFLCVICIAAIPCAAETATVMPYDVRSGALPNGWDIEKLIEQTNAQDEYAYVESVVANYGYTASIDWVHFIVGFNIKYSELSDLKDLSDCESVFDDPVLFIPVYAEINGELRIPGWVEIGEREGEFYSEGCMYSDFFISGEDPIFLDSFDIPNGFAGTLQAIGQEDVDLLVFARWINTASLMLTYNQSDGWQIYDYQNQANFPRGEEQPVLSIDAFLAQRKAYHRRVVLNNPEFYIWPYVGIAVVIVGIVVVCLLLHRKRKRERSGY